MAKGFDQGGSKFSKCCSHFTIDPWSPWIDVSIPVITRGGIWSSRRGAHSVAFGNRGILLNNSSVTYKSPIHDNYKNALIGATDTETVSLNFPVFSIRLWKNKEKVIELKDGNIDQDFVLETGY